MAAMEVSATGAERLTCAYESGATARFIVANGAKTYSQQYSHVYNKRLLALKADLVAAAEKRWPGVAVAERVVTAADAEEGAEIVVIGTAFKDMSARPDVVSDYQTLFSSATSGADDAKATYVGPDDTLVLEDESGRVQLIGSGAPVSTVCTGVVLAARGTVTASGGLDVVDYCGPGLGAPRPCPAFAGAAPKLLLLYAPAAGSPAGEDRAGVRFALLTEWLAGEVGGDDGAAASVARVIVAGDVVRCDVKDLEGRDRSTRALADAGGGNGGGGSDDALAPLRAADVRLARLAALAPTVAMPGARDPTSYALPQQPLHPLLLPTAHRFSTFSTAPNPHECGVGGRVVLGHAGQPVVDQLKYADYRAEDRGRERPFRDGGSANARHVDGADLGRRRRDR